MLTSVGMPPPQTMRGEEEPRGLRETIRVLRSRNILPTLQLVCSVYSFFSKSARTPRPGNPRLQSQIQRRQEMRRSTFGQPRLREVAVMALIFFLDGRPTSIHVVVHRKLLPDACRECLQTKRQLTHLLPGQCGCEAKESSAELEQEGPQAGAAPLEACLHRGSLEALWSRQRSYKPTLRICAVESEPGCRQGQEGRRREGSRGELSSYAFLGRDPGPRS